MNLMFVARKCDDLVIRDIGRIDSFVMRARSKPHLNVDDCSIRDVRHPAPHENPPLVLPGRHNHYSFPGFDLIYPLHQVHVK